MSQESRTIEDSVFRSPNRIAVNIALLVASVLLLIILIVFKSTRAGFGHWFLFSYTVLVTVFQLFRLSASLIFPKFLSQIVYPVKAENYEPMVTIVVPCKNEEAAIKHTLEACFEAEYPKEKLEVIVINDGSTDGTIHQIGLVKKNHPELIVIDWKENRGKREGMAAGFRQARGEIVVQLDSDSYIEPKTFKELIQPFANPAIGAVCAHGDVANADKNIITKMQSGYYYVSFRLLKAAESIFFSVLCCSGCSSAYRKDIVLPVLDSWLKESFLGVTVKHGDDRSLTGWVLKRGFRTVYTDRARAYTIAPENIRQLMKQQVRWKKSWVSNAYFTFKYIFKTDPLFGALYYVPLILISFVTPLVALLNLYLLPTISGESPVIYLLGGIITSLLFVMCALYYARGERRYIGYFLLWQILSAAVLSFILYYSFARFRDQRWGTR